MRVHVYDLLGTNITWQQKSYSYTSYIHIHVVTRWESVGVYIQSEFESSFSEIWSYRYRNT